MRRLSQRSTNTPATGLTTTVASANAISTPLTAAGADELPANRIEAIQSSSVDRKTRPCAAVGESL